MKEFDLFPFFDAGKVEDVEFWGIENSWPSKRFLNHGFHENEVWMVLQTKQILPSYALTHNLHVWVGACSLAADLEVANRYAIALDLFLRRRTTLHWEHQYHECDLFLSYFVSGLHYLSGIYREYYYNKNYKPTNQLFSVYTGRNKQNVRVNQVKCDMSSLNNQDPCILMTDELIYILPRGTWNHDRLKTTATEIRFREHVRHNLDVVNMEVILLDQSALISDWDDFYELLGWKDKNSFPRLPDSGQHQAEEIPAAAKLYEIKRNRKGRVYYESIRFPLQKEVLNSQSLYIFTSDTDDVNIWIGKKNQDRNKAKNYGMAKIQEYRSRCRSKFPSWTHMAIVPEGLEPMEFKEQFQNWITH